MTVSRGATNLGLIYRGKSENLETFTDSSFRDHLDLTLTSGIVVFSFGDIITWRSYKEGGVNPSTCHTEYFAMSEACQEAISLDKALRDTLGKTMYPIVLKWDNRSVVDCTQKESSHKLKSFEDSPSGPG